MRLFAPNTSDQMVARRDIFMAPFTIFSFTPSTHFFLIFKSKAKASRELMVLGDAKRLDCSLIRNLSGTHLAALYSV